MYINHALNLTWNSPIIIVRTTTSIEHREKKTQSTFHPVFNMTSKLLILSILSACFAYDENIRFADFYECEEVLVKSEEVQHVFPIDCLWNNEVNNKETLRIKLFVLGFDMHIHLLSHGGDFLKKHHAVYLSGNVGNSNWPIKSGIMEVEGTSWGDATDVVTTTLTDNFFFTELYLVVKKGEVVEHDLLELTILL